MSRAARRPAGRNALPLAGRVGEGVPARSLRISRRPFGRRRRGYRFKQQHGSGSFALAACEFPDACAGTPSSVLPVRGRRKGGLAPSRHVSLGLARADLFLFAKRKDAGAGLLLSPPLEGGPKTPWRFRGGVSFGSAEACLAAGRVCSSRTETVWSACAPAPKTQLRFRPALQGRVKGSVRRERAHMHP